jgi:hypothetical protein
MKRRVSPHPDHLTPADRPAWKARRAALSAEMDSDTAQALQSPCGVCGAPVGVACLSLDGTPHALRLT